MGLKLKKSVIDRLKLVNSQNKKYTILAVDDEEANLNSIKRTLEKEYNVLTARDGQEGLDLLKSLDDPSQVNLIISDQRMPGLNGVDFLTKTIPFMAKTIRIILTGFTDLDCIISAINEGAIYKFLTKPIEPQDLLLTVKRGLEAYDLELRNLKLAQDLQEINAHLEEKVAQRTLELKEKAKIISAQSRERKELIHILCHDLMNPLGCISTMSELLEFNPEMLGDILGDLKLASQSAENIINHVRKITALDSNKTALELEHLPLKELIKESISLLQYKLDKKNIKIDLNMIPDLTVKVERISFINSVMNNLITNAIKFSHPDSVIKIKTQKTADLIELSIKDAGIGIPPRILADIFEINKATSREGTDGERGTGFGMPLVKKFINAFGGEIEILSKEDPDYFSKKLLKKLNKTSENYLPEKSSDYGTEIKLTLPQS